MVPSKESYWLLEILHFNAKKRKITKIHAGAISNHAIERLFERSGWHADDFLEELVAPIVFYLVEGLNRTISEDKIKGECEIDSMIGKMHAVYCEQADERGWMIKTVIPVNKLSEKKLLDWGINRWSYFDDFKG